MFASILLPLLAQAHPELKDTEALRRAARPTTISNEVLAILICALALSVVLFIWAFFIRKRPRVARGALVVERARRKDSHQDDDQSKKRRRKRRPEHPDNWGRNPTLGETGGLPPARTEGDADADANAGETGPQQARPH